MSTLWWLAIAVGVLIALAVVLAIIFSPTPSAPNASRSVVYGPWIRVTRDDDAAEPRPAAQSWPWWEAQTPAALMQEEPKTP